MADILELPVRFQNEDLTFPMEMIRWGFTHRFKINVNDRDYFFEPDEEGGYRAISEDQSGVSQPVISLLRAIGETLSTLMQ